MLCEILEKITLIDNNLSMNNKTSATLLLLKSNPLIRSKIYYIKENNIIISSVFITG